MRISISNAIKLLTEDPRAKVTFSTRDATLSHWISIPVWLEGDRLVRSHPTDPRGQSIDAPSDADYYYDAEVRS
jgi:hypothetical protein